MKKTLLILLFLVAIPVSGLTLYQFFGGKLPTVAQRAPVFRAYFPDENYRGSAEQNIRFVEKLTTEPLLGAAFTTLVSTDQLTAFPAVYNVNLGNSANTTTPNSWSGLQQFNGNASSSLFSCYGTCYFGRTATSTFGDAGALTLATALTIANGGTGSTTLSSNQVLLGNGTGNIGTVSGWGTTDQVLGSTGGTGAPTWRTFATPLGDNYAWTGLHTFSASTTGKVGIGTTSPFTALGVVGTITSTIINATSTTATSTFSGNAVVDNNLTVSGRFIGAPSATSTTFTASGTWVRPSNVYKVRVFVQGGGGGGGGAGTAGTSLGGGGGGGGYAEAIVSVTGNVTVTVGGGGAGGAGATPAAGDNGVNSSFAGATTITGAGATGGSAGNGSAGGGGGGGSCTNADICVVGSAGEAGNEIKTGTTDKAGKGGFSHNGFPSPTRATGVSTAGNEGGNYGSGGGGASSSGGSSANGGAGAGGFVRVEWYE